MKNQGSDWLSNLGLAAIGGYMVGGGPGAFIALTIAASFMLIEESIKKAIKDVKMTKMAMDAIMRGESTGDILKDYQFGYQGTSTGAIPQFVQAEQRRLSYQLSPDQFTQTLGNVYNIDTMNLTIPQPEDLNSIVVNNLN